MTSGKVEIVLQDDDVKRVEAASGFVRFVPPLFFAG
jgi:hypothetical protein